MKKIYIIVFFSIIAVVLASFLGWFAYEAMFNGKEEKNIQLSMKEELIEDECTDFVNQQENIIQTVANDDKISPNAIIIFKTYHKLCKHTKQENVEVPIKLVNLGRKELQDYYGEWELKGFSNNEIVLYKEVDGYCDEHYKIKRNGGKVCIYHLDETGKSKLEKDTDVSMDFLPDEDREKLEDGIEIIGLDNVNKILEDFE